MIDKNFLVEKQNTLNEMRNSNMTLQELRLFTVYLSRINARDVETKKVEFSINDFKDIFEVKKINKQYIKDVFDKLVSKKVTLETDEGICTFVLFQYCEFKYDNETVEICASDKALPFLFDFKDQYFSYKLYNALNLKSANHLRMYEILKQYELIGTRTIPLEELRALLGLQDSYAEFKAFKRDILEKSKKALEEFTDIFFEYELVKKGTRVAEIKFNVKRNKNFIDTLRIEEFIQMQKENPVYEINKKSHIDDLFVNTSNDNDGFDYEFWRESCCEEFTNAQIKTLYAAVDKSPFEVLNGTRSHDFAIFDFIQEQYYILNVECERKTIFDRFKYFLAMLKG